MFIFEWIPFIAISLVLLNGLFLLFAPEFWMLEECDDRPMAHMFFTFYFLFSFLVPVVIFIYYLHYAFTLNPYYGLYFSFNLLGLIFSLRGILRRISEVWG